MTFVCVVMGAHLYKYTLYKCTCHAHEPSHGLFLFTLCMFVSFNFSCMATIEVGIMYDQIM